MNYDDLKLAAFLCPNIEEDIPILVRKFIAKVYCHMVEHVKTNFREMYANIICDACNISECTQSHLLSCTALIGGNELVTYLPEYKDIFNGSIEEKVKICGWRIWRQ